MTTRVAIVLPYFSNGGAQVMIARLASHLDLKAVDAEVICIYGKPQNNKMEQTILAHGVPIRFIGKGKGFSAGAVKALYEELNRFRPDVVHTHLSAGVYCALWVLVHHKKMLHTVHNMPQHELIRTKRIIMRLLYRLNCAVPVAISHEIQTMMKEYYHLKQDAELVYNPVDVKLFSKAEKVPHDSFVVLNIGRLSEQKNQRLLIEAFSQLQQRYGNAELYILGDGPFRKELQDMIEQQGLAECVHLEGNVEHVEKYCAKADVFVLSSIYEGLPLVVLEAMAASLPVIATDVGGVKDIVTDNGILVESGNRDQMVNALITLMENLNLRRDMSIKSYENVQQFDSEKIADQYICLYREYSKHRN